jgi:hypothetical protein
MVDGRLMEAFTGAVHDLERGAGETCTNVFVVGPVVRCWRHLRRAASTGSARTTTSVWSSSGKCSSTSLTGLAARRSETSTRRVGPARRRGVVLASESGWSWSAP